MCGIVGIFAADLGVVEVREALDRMMRAVVHRGPDEAGSLIFGHHRAGIGCRRLSILDLEHGSQPMPNEDGTVHVVLNGEIYNHCELRAELEQKGHTFRSRSDTEVIAHLYEERGDDCLEALNGMFGLAILDSRSGRLLLARDRCGMKPLYFAQTSNGFLFASEIKSLLASGLVPAEPDLEAVDSFLTVGYVPVPRTGFRGVKKLEPGEALTVDAHGVTPRVFWRVGFDNAKPPATEQEYAHELESRLTAAVKSHLVADVPVGAFISGGMDSSLVAALAVEHATYPLKTFSVVFPEDNSVDESRYSRELVQQLGTEHHEIEFRISEAPDLLPKMVRHLEEPSTVGPGMATYKLASAAARHVKVVLSGEGSDEIFAGYAWLGSEAYYRIRPLVPRIFMRKLAEHSRSLRVRRVLRTLAAPDEVSADIEWFRIMTPNEKARALRLTAPSSDLDPIRPHPDTLASSADILQRRLALDFTRRLANGILLMGDKMTMAHSLETRMPFLDRGVVDFGLALPSRMKWRGKRGKYILSLLANRLPPEIAHRRKRGFQYPIRSMQRGPFADFARAYLLDSAKPGGLIDRHFLESALAQWQGEGPAGLRLITALLTLRAWCNEFFPGL
ncbi:MAG TPA: asparagine synthase (glutamine-hydrolyzing) [Bryobacteraceae bacterium]|nr:asparagine synthase (glutamine-hydrolyzing) [Bryobacteraceae bacterium]